MKEFDDLVTKELLEIKKLIDIAIKENNVARRQKRISHLCKRLDAVKVIVW